MRTGYSTEEVVMGSSKERLEKQQEGNCNFLAAMQHGRDHESGQHHRADEEISGWTRKCL